MTKYRRELPGDVLRDLMEEYDLPSIADFDRKHQLRISEAMSAEAEEMTEDEEEEMMNRLAPNYQQWYNRFRIIWKSSENPKKVWRASFTVENLASLVLAGWFNEEAEFHTRFQRAMRLQDALYMDLFSYEDLEDDFEFDETVDYNKVYDTICKQFADFLEQHPETRGWSFARIASFAVAFAKNALEGLVNLRIIDPPEGWLEGLPGLDQTRMSPTAVDQRESELLSRISDWAGLILADALDVEDTAKA